MEKKEQPNQEPKKKSVSEMINEFKDVHDMEQPENVAQTSGIPTPMSPDQFEGVMQKETDPDLMTTYELVKFPSGGKFYENKLSEVEVEYMTSKDEDLITTPSLIESGKVLDILLKRKIKTKGVVVEKLLPGDRNAVLLFLRTSSYGFDYTVQVGDPRTGVPFNAVVDLGKLEYKEMGILPDKQGNFTVELPMRKKTLKFRMLSTGEDTMLFNQAEEIKEAYGNEFSEYNTMKLKAQTVSINGNADRSYIDRFIDAMPALDALTIRKKVLEVSPDVDMLYEFTAKDGFKFKATLTVGVDFFFPAT